MFPTLFPLGIDGFKDPNKVVGVSFQAHANLLLDVPGHSFLNHHLFKFFVLNIIQWRAGHLQTHFIVWKLKFGDITIKLIPVTPKTLQTLADHLECEGKIDQLNGEERNAMFLLNKVMTVSVHIPGSQASRYTCEMKSEAISANSVYPYLLYLLS